MVTHMIWAVLCGICFATVATVCRNDCSTESSSEQCQLAKLLHAAACW